ncbi:ABC exporter membrane fusion protein, DevB family [Halomicronema hongdechloris C2206]|uniref:ABC exporter membrane fusion protein, DevB family n=1 Tax=Halomicronema hongdechloris C2206 TaxID=1641165 RepID=A0A1Z3HP01_9CYAN|nr:efflux RND transporter periplasmic adaptor subunit [Halomicronema hongdechloris]ASC72034.1 ABC exporter membrane fusion protein, DevB family [Halomicronema hongdechloris C2206]
MHLPLIGKVRRPWLWVLGIGVAAAVIISGSALWFWRNRGPQYDVEALTQPVTEQPLTIRITASGTVQPIQTVNLSPKNAGILQALYVEQGDRVNQGQLIARMESEDEQAQIAQRQAAVAEAEAQLQDVLDGNRPQEIAQASAALEAAQAQLRDNQARLDLANAQLERNRQLQARGAISLEALDTARQEQQSAQAAYERAQAQVQEAEQRLQDLRTQPTPEAEAQARARLAQAQAQLQAAQVQLENTLVRAPFAGVITQKFATEGAFVTPTTSASDATSATSTAIVALAQDLEILAEVPEADIGAIQPGQAVEIRADAFPEEVFRGRVRLIAPEAIERQNVTLFQVRIELLTGKEQLLSNMNVTVAFIGEQLEEALVVPAVAIITQEGRTGVLVPDERGDIEFRPVTLGSQVGEQIQILEGLEPGDRIFTDLPPGQSIESLTFGRD